MTSMVNNIARLDTQPALKLFADWTDRIEAGELPQGNADAAARRRAQHRRDPVGLGRPDALPA